MWYCMELCGLGPVSDVAAALTRIQRRLNEDQIAYIIKEVRLCVVKCCKTTHRFHNHGGGPY